VDRHGRATEVGEVAIVVARDQQVGQGEVKRSAHQFSVLARVRIEQGVPGEDRDDGVRLPLTVVAPMGLDVEVVPPSDAVRRLDRTAGEAVREVRCDRGVAAARIERRETHVRGCEESQRLDVLDTRDPQDRAQVDRKAAQGLDRRAAEQPRPCGAAEQRRRQGVVGIPAGAVVAGERFGKISGRLERFAERHAPPEDM
jgi:hypothetical protein